MTPPPIIFSAPMVRALLNGRKTQTRRLAYRKDANFVGDGPAHPGSAVEYVNLGSTPIPLQYRASPWQRVKPGDLLWVRENVTYWERPGKPRGWDDPGRNESSRPSDGVRYQRWISRVTSAELVGEDYLQYLADKTRRPLGEWQYPHRIYEHCIGRFGKVIPSIHMPRWASRLTLAVTDARVQRLHEITAHDARAEGVHQFADLEIYGFDPKGTPGNLCGSSFDDAFRLLWGHLHGTESWNANPHVVALTFTVHQQNIDDFCASVRRHD